MGLDDKTLLNAYKTALALDRVFENEDFNHPSVDVRKQRSKNLLFRRAKSPKV